jgi:hypothetical protein
MLKGNYQIPTEKEEKQSVYSFCIYHKRIISFTRILDEILKYYQMLNRTIRFEVFDFINDGGYNGSSRL